MGEHPMVARFVKGVRCLRPSGPRYSETWDAETVVKYLRDLDVSTLKALTLKFTMLLALVTAQRAETLNKFKISELRVTEESVQFVIGETLKTVQAGKACVELTVHLEDERLCVVSVLHKYLRATKAIRNSDTLLISFTKPYGAVHVDTIRRWLLSVMGAAGINTDVFKPHSTRAAATSKAKEKAVPISAIMAAGMWRQVSTFTKFYDKPIKHIQKNVVTETEHFQSAILDCV